MAEEIKDIVVFPYRYFFLKFTNEILDLCILTSFLILLRVRDADRVRWLVGVTDGATGGKLNLFLLKFFY